MKKSQQSVRCAREVSILRIQYRKRQALLSVEGVARRNNHRYADGNHRVPNVNRNSDGDDKFNLGNFENDWNDDNVLVVFRDIDDFLLPQFFEEVFCSSCRRHPPSILPVSSRSASNVAYIGVAITF